MNDLTELIKRVRENLIPVIKTARTISERINSDPELKRHIQEYIDDPVSAERKSWSKAAEFGWFANWLTPITFTHFLEVRTDVTGLNKFMINQIESDIAEIENRLVGLYPQREEILKTAFKLHREKNYIASIPLLLAQCDGICAEEIRAFLFTERDKLTNGVDSIISSLENEFGSIIYAPLITRTQFGAGISKSSNTKKALAPNRSGILHGSRKHLDYGTKLNSLKSISLLAYCGTIFDKEYMAD